MEYLKEKAILRIYRSFMEGKSVNAIADELTKEGMPTPGHKEIWQHTTVKSSRNNVGNKKTGHSI